MSDINSVQDLDKFLGSPLPNKQEQKKPFIGPPEPKKALPEFKSVQDLDAFIKTPIQHYDLTPVQKYRKAQATPDTPDVGSARATRAPMFPKLDQFLQKLGDVKVAGDLTARQAWERSNAPLGDTSYEDRSQAKYQQFLKENRNAPLWSLASLEALGFGVEHAVTGLFTPQNMLMLAGMGVMNPRSAVKGLVDAGFSAQMAYGAVNNLNAAAEAFKRGDALSGITSLTDASVSGLFSYMSGKGAVHEAEIRLRADAMRKAVVRKLDDLSQAKFQRPWKELNRFEQAELTYNLATDKNAPISAATAKRMGIKLPGDEREEFYRRANAEAVGMSRGLAAARKAVPPTTLSPPPEIATPAPVPEFAKIDELNKQLDEVIRKRNDAVKRGDDNTVVQLDGEKARIYGEMDNIRMAVGVGGGLPTPGAELPDNDSMYQTPEERSQRYYTLEEARKRLDEERRLASQEQEARSAAESENQRIARERREQFEGEKEYRDARSGKRFVVTERRGLEFDNLTAEANKQEHQRLTDEMNRMAEEHMYVDVDDMMRSIDTEKGRGRTLDSWKTNVLDLESKRRELLRLSDPTALEPRRTEAFQSIAEDMKLAKRETDMRDAAVKIEAEAKKQTDAEEFERMTAEADEAKQRAEEIRTERDKKEAERIAATAEREEYPLGAVMDMVKGVGANLILPDGRKVAFHYAIVPAEQVISSHDPFNNFEPNDKAIQISQGRDYKNNRESQAATIARGKNPEMDLLVNTAPTAETGPPIVRSDGQALGGRNRVNIWKLLYKNGFDDLAYQSMTSKARELGVTPEQISNYYTTGRQPMLVRVLDDPYTSAKDLAQLGRDLDRTQTMGFSEAEEAVMAGRSLSMKTLEWMSGQLDSMEEDSSVRDIMRFRGNEIVERMMDEGMVSPTQRAEFITPNGEMTEKAKNLFEAAVRGKVIDDPELLQTTPREILRKLDRALAALARVKAAGGVWDFTPELKSALMLWKRVDSVRDSLNEIGAKDDSLVDKYLNPGKYKMGTELMNFGGDTVRETPHPTVEALAKLLEKTGKEVKEAIGDYADDSEGRQITLGPAPTAVESFNRNIASRVKVDVPDEAWGVMRPLGKALVALDADATDATPDAVSSPIKEDVTPDPIRPTETPVEAPVVAGLPNLEGGVNVGNLENILSQNENIAPVAKPLIEAMGTVVKNALRMDLGEFLKKAWADIRTSGTPGEAGLEQGLSDVASWARNLGSRLTVTPYGEQLDIFGGAEPQFMLRDGDKTESERLVLKSELLKIRDQVPQLRRRFDLEGNAVSIPEQGDLFGPPPGMEEDEGPQGTLFQSDDERLKSLWANTTSVGQKETEWFGKAKAELFPGKRELSNTEIAQVSARARDMRIAAEKGILFQEKNGPWIYKSEVVLNDAKLANAQSGEQWAAMLRNKGVKADELKWMGIDDFLAGKKKVTRQELLDFIRENQLQVTEIAHNQDQFYRDPATGNQVLDGVGGFVENRNATKYSQYTLPGEKKNYTELLITLPDERTTSAARTEFDRLQTERATHLAMGESVPDQLEEQFQAAQKKMLGLPQQFTSSHFDEPNVLAHVRFDERTDAAGNRILFVEEVQSDWHQKGKKAGYTSPTIKQDVAKANAEVERQRSNFEKKYEELAGHSATEASPVVQRAKLVEAYRGSPPDEEAGRILDALDRAVSNWQELEFQHRAGTVPDAPFKSDWHELVMRRMLREAAERGFDKIAWVTGEQTAARYDLSKQVDALDYDPTWKVLSGYKGEKMVISRNVAPDKLADLIGKDAAEKLLKSIPDPQFGMHFIEGDDLKVGGEWAQALYDRAIPNYMSKYGKKWGAKVQDLELPISAYFERVGNRYEVREGTPDENEESTYYLWDRWNNEPEDVHVTISDREFAEEIAADRNREAEEEMERAAKQSSAVHSMGITREMKKSVLEGQPLFQSGKKGATEFLNDGKAVVYLFNNADASTFLHEFFHTMRRYLPAEDSKVLEDWMGIKDGIWSRADEEKSARAWEYYHHQKAAKTLPEKVIAVFKKIQDAMRKVYDTLRGSPLVKPSKEVAALFDRWYGKDMEAPPEAKATPQRLEPPPALKEKKGEASNRAKEIVNLHGQIKGIPEDIDGLQGEIETLQRFIDRSESKKLDENDHDAMIRNQYFTEAEVPEEEWKALQDDKSSWKEYIPGWMGANPGDVYPTRLTPTELQILKDHQQAMQEDIQGMQEALPLLQQRLDELKAKGPLPQDVADRHKLTVDGEIAQEKAKAALEPPPAERPEQADLPGAQIEARRLLKEGVTAYGSGSNRIADIRGMVKAGIPVGVDVSRLSEATIKELESLRGSGVPVFVDSGAFGEMRVTDKGLEVGQEITDAEWRKRLDVYHRLADALHGQLTVVAPDRVGDQGVTLERLKKYGKDLQDLKAKDVEIIVPVQFGSDDVLGNDHHPDEFYFQANEAAGFNVIRPEMRDKTFNEPTDTDSRLGMVPGLPMNKAGMKPEDVQFFIEQVRPHRVHLLGMGPASDAADGIIKALHQVDPKLQITMDSSLLRAHTGEGRGITEAQRSGLPREQAVAKGLGGHKAAGQLEPPPAERAQRAISGNGYEFGHPWAEPRSYPENPDDITTEGVEPYGLERAWYENISKFNPKNTAEMQRQLDQARKDLAHDKQQYIKARARAIEKGNPTERGDIHPVHSYLSGMYNGILREKLRIAEFEKALGDKAKPTEIGDVKPKYYERVPSNEWMAQQDPFWEPTPEQFRSTPAGEPTVGELLKPGDIIRSNYSDIPYVVGSVTPRMAYDHETFDIGMRQYGKKGKSDAGISELVAEGGKIRKLFKNNDDEVFKITPEEARKLSGSEGDVEPRTLPKAPRKKGEKIEPSAKLDQQALTSEERNGLTLKAQGGILPLDTGAVRSKVFSDFKKATEWAKANQDKIKGLQIFQLKDGRAVADFTAKQANVLFQSDYEREREIAFANVKIGMLQDKLKHIVSDAERARINRDIRDLRAKRESVKAVGMEPPPGEVVSLWTPEGAVEVKREAPKESRPTRTVPDEAIRLSEPERPRKAAEQPRTSGVPQPKPATGGGVRTSPAGKGSGTSGGQPRTSLRDVRPVDVAPVRQRGEAAYSQPDWESRVERFRLPQNAPAPTRQISDELARMLMPGQREVVESIVSGLDQHDGYILATTTGTGKCLAPGTPVLMFDGTIKKVEDVRVGDLLMGPDSKPRVVLSLASGEDNMYRVAPTKGDPYGVNEPHILSLKMTKSTFSGKKWDGKIINIPVSEYLQKSRTWKHCAKGYRVGVDFADRDVPLRPYLLGTWLGDGSSHLAAITTVDPEIISYWNATADWFGLHLRVDQSGDRTPTYTLTSRIRGGDFRDTNIIQKRLKVLGVLRNKHIPLLYKANSRKNRLELLAGLMDTDGSLSDGGFDFISKSKVLAEDVAFVARSLGFAAYISPCKKTCANNGKVGNYFRVSISGDVSQIPVRIRYKQAAPRKQKKDVLVTGIKVEPVGRGKYFGFEISGDGLFLLGDFTVTHNTYMGSTVIADLLARKPDAQVLVLTPSQSLVHGRDGWIQVAGNFGIEIEPLPVGGTPDKPGVFIKTWAGGIANRDIEMVPWDLVIMDEVQEARKWWSSQRGDMSKTMGENARKILYTSATPFHTALEIGHMGKLGLWGGKGFERWAAENGLGVYRDKAGNLSGGNSPLRLEKLRQQLIERGQMINLDRNMDGYSAHFGKVPMDAKTQQGLRGIDEALTLAERYFERSGKKGMIQAVKAQRTTLAKRWLEYQRLPQAVELARKLETQGWKVIFFSENKKEFTELFDFLKPADDAMGGLISQKMPKFANTAEVLQDAFGEDVAVFAGKHSAAREGEKDAFNDDKKSHLYATYGAGGVGVSLHDRGGDKPRAVIYLGPPWSGISFDQALGRPWRYGTKSNVRAYFLFSDSQAEMNLVTTKVAPRMESLRAMVSGVNFDDPVVKNLRAVPDTQVAVIDYDHGNAHEAGFDEFTKRVDASGVTSYSDLPIVSADEAKNKGMRLPGSEGAQDPSVVRLWQDSVDDEVLPKEFEAPELTMGRAVNVEIAERFIDSGAAPGNTAGRRMDPMERRTLADYIMAKAEAAASKDPDSAVQQVYTEWENGMKQADAILSGDAEPPSMEPPPGEGIPNVPGGSEAPKPEKIGKMKSFEWYALTNGRDVIRAATKKAGVPEVGEKIARSIAQYHVEAGNISGPWTTRYWDILKDNKITPAEHKVLALTLANREKPSPSIDRQLAELRAKTPMNERIEKAVQQTQAVFKEVFKRMQTDNIYLTVFDAETGKPRQIYYNEFASGEGYWPRKYDYAEDHRVRDPETGVETVFSLRNLTRGEMGGTKRESIIRGMMDRYGLSRSAVEDFLQSRKRDVPLAGHIERAREADMAFFRTDPEVVISYLEHAGELLSRKKYFAQDGSKVKGLLAQIPDQKARNISAGIVEGLLKRNPMEDESRALLRFASDWSVMKMTFSAIKVLGHPLHGSLLTNMRAFGKALFEGVVDYKDAQRRAQLAGSIQEQTKVEMLSEFGINKKGLSSALLKWNGWQGAYKWGRVVSDANARIYMTDYALGKLLKNPKNEVVRRQLKEFMQLDDSRIDGAIERRRWNEDDLAWAGKAFSDKVMFTFDPTELPPWWRARAGAEHPAEDALLASVRVMTLLKGYQFKTHALLKDAIWDEAKKGNFRPLIPFLLLYPGAGLLIHSLTALATGNTKYFRTLMDDKSWTPGKTLWRMVDETAHMIGDTALTAWLDAAVHGKETLSGTIGEEYFMGAAMTDASRTVMLPAQLQHAKTSKAKAKVAKRYVQGTFPVARTVFNLLEPPPGEASSGVKVMPRVP